MATARLASLGSRPWYAATGTIARRSPFVIRPALPEGSCEATVATISAATQPSAGRSSGVRTQRAPPGSHHAASVSVPQSATAIDIGAIDQGSAAARTRNESAAARPRAEDMAADRGPCIGRGQARALP